MRPILRDLPVPITTRRLEIRPPRPGDGVALNQAVHETLEDLRLWMPWAREAPSLQDSEEFARRAQADWILRQDLTVVLFHRETGELVGASGFHRINWEVPRFEIGYWIRRSYQGRGYVSESTAALTQYAFEAMGARRVEIRCDAENIRSRAVPERLGYVLEACLHGDAWQQMGVGEDPSLRDTLIYARTSIQDLPYPAATWQVAS